MTDQNPYWIAPRTKQDWRDEDVLRAVTWLKSFVPENQMNQRLDAARRHLIEARLRQREGHSANLFDSADVVAWYIFQAETFATDRNYWTQEGALSIVPTLTRLGKELDLLLSIHGVETRASRLMLAEKKQPDAGLFELLVALAYRRGEWPRVEFVPETPGLGRTPDIHIFRPGCRWAVECKRLMPSPYAANEKLRGEQLAGPIHSLSIECGVSCVVEVVYKRELAQVPDDYLIEHVRGALRLESRTQWDDEIARGRVRPVNWHLARHVLDQDDVYFGGSRMIELLAGSYSHEADHSLSAIWTPAPARPSYAEDVDHASVVSWRSGSLSAMTKKARHFRKTLGGAENQLPTDRPSVIHIGLESYAGAQVDHFRHVQNMLEARDFKVRNSRLRWVYGNYFAPEATTHENEAWALTETMAPYKIGSHRTAWPLPNHLLMSPEQEARPGVHWHS